MLHALRRFFADDVETNEEVSSDIYAAYQSGLQGLDYIGCWTKGTHLAHTRGRNARFGSVVIDLPRNAPRLTTNLFVVQAFVVQA